MGSRLINIKLKLEDRTKEYEAGAQKKSKGKFLKTAKNHKDRVPIYTWFHQKGAQKKRKLRLVITSSALIRD